MRVLKVLKWFNKHPFAIDQNQNNKIIVLGFVSNHWNFSNSFKNSLFSKFTVEIIFFILLNSHSTETVQFFFLFLAGVFPGVSTVFSLPLRAVSKCSSSSSNFSAMFFSLKTSRSLVLHLMRLGRQSLHSLLAPFTFRKSSKKCFHSTCHQRLYAAPLIPHFPPILTMLLLMYPPKSKQYAMPARPK